MLIKSVAIKELMLPSDAHEKGDAPLSETIETVQKVLDQVKPLPSFTYPVYFPHSYNVHDSSYFTFQPYRTPPPPPSPKLSSISYS